MNSGERLARLLHHAAALFAPGVEGWRVTALGPLPTLEAPRGVVLSAPSPGAPTPDALLLPDGWSRDDVEELVRELGAPAPRLLSLAPAHVRWGADLALGEDGVLVVAGAHAVRARGVLPAGLAWRSVPPEPAAPIALPEGATPPVRLGPPPRLRWPDGAPEQAAPERVVLRLAVLADGRVAEVATLSGRPAFAEAASREAWRWRFEPARHRGRAVAAYHVVTVRFRPRSAALWRRHVPTLLHPPCAEPSASGRPLPGQ